MEDCILTKQKPRIDGYVQVYQGYHRPRKYAHRLAYEEKYGEIPENMTIDHLCFTRNCINPNHLKMVTQSVNASRRSKPKNICKRGHEYNKVYDYGKYRVKSCYACNKLRNKNEVN